MTLRVGFLSSHEGTVVQSVVSALAQKEIGATVCVIISNNSDSEVLNFARKEGIPLYCIQKHDDQNIVQKLQSHSVDVVVLDGYYQKISDIVLNILPVFNIHPSLLPRYGGQGMYGDHIFQAVLESDDSKTGVTIHRVREEYDQGEIIAQQTVLRLADDTVETLKLRVNEVAQKLCLKVFQDILHGKISLR